MELPPCRVRKSTHGWFCSRKCNMLFAHPRYWLGKKMSKKLRDKLSRSGREKFKNGYIQWNKGLRGEKSPMYGSRNPMWKGGVSTVNARLRSSAEFIEWRNSVYKRDDWTCTVCKRRSKKGQRLILNADHIKPWSKFPELRFDINNGRTLCLDCHKQTDTYGRKIK